MIIFAGKTHHIIWFENTNLSLNWTIAVSDNDWTTDAFEFKWLQSVFESNIKNYTIRIYWLLILDKYSNHFAPQFNQFCTECKIVPLCMLLHFLHILQPFDVGCFSILKCLYSCQVEQFIRLSINHINKPDFLISYKQVCMEPYKI